MSHHCKNAASGCNYPEGECAGLCMQKDDPAEALRKFNEWRSGELGDSISLAISMVLAELHLLRKRVKEVAS